ncbi:hypothetical protein O7605_30015 [Verrucosispora sp. WMMA2121]|uniref:hypothetical protein n=1 Tax=Verrucosispora sp. WMMA2121 TaxID=3015164 RepID=UPI0022B6C4ED|nr:hypothetical protein [Verrucosispora sp. WMMA2121]MCZ7423752.1 hypothetical protein [Verrucosispora sp. WMMA2121]
MLEGVVDHYLQNVTEREFDAPLLALLAASGFFDIHKIHGAYEFGKDFIAKRQDDGRVRQYSIQSKAGDINTAAWREIRAQVDEARYNTIAHPSFDSTMERVAVLVTTGRLVGGAAPDAQQYREFLKGRGEIGFDVWDQDLLRQWLVGDPTCGLAGGLTGDFLAVLGAIDQGTVNQRQLERHTRTWATAPLPRVAIEVAVVAERLRENRRSDMAAFAAICALRAARSQPGAKNAEFFAGLARQLHAAYGLGLLEQYRAAIEDPRSLLNEVSPLMPHIVYPIVCLRLVETWGLLALQLGLSEPERRACAEAVSTVLSSQPGVERPPSDGWAHSVLLGALGSWVVGGQSVERYLEAVFVWLLDRYEDGWGLPSSEATETEEIEFLVGPPLLHVEKKQRSHSYLAAVLLDLCVIFGLPRLYEQGVGDLQALGVVPTLLLADESLARWGAGEFGLRAITNARYAAKWTDGPPFAQHHLARVDTIDSWDALALSTLPRNRHPFQAIVDLALAGKIEPSENI